MNPINNIINFINTTVSSTEQITKKRKSSSEDSINEISKKALKSTNETLSQLPIEAIKANTHDYQINDSFEAEEEKLNKQLEIINQKKYIIEYFRDHENEYKLFMKCIQNKYYLSINNLTSACVYLQLAYKVGSKNQNIITTVNKFLESYPGISNIQNQTDITNLKNSEQRFIIVNFHAQKFDISLLSSFSGYFQAAFGSFKSNQVFEVLMSPLLEENSLYVFDILNNCQKDKNNSPYDKTILENLSVEEVINYYKILNYLQINHYLINDIKDFFSYKIINNHQDYLSIINDDPEFYLNPKDIKKICNYFFRLPFKEIQGNPIIINFIQKNISQLNTINLNFKHDIFIDDPDEESNCMLFFTWLNFLNQTQLRASRLNLVVDSTLVYMNKDYSTSTYLEVTQLNNFHKKD